MPINQNLGCNGNGWENSHFFFVALKHRQSRNRIDSLYTESGVFLTDPDQVAREFYQQLLGSRAPYPPGVDR